MKDKIVIDQINIPPSFSYISFFKSSNLFAKSNSEIIGYFRKLLKIGKNKLNEFIDGKFSRRNNI